MMKLPLFLGCWLLLTVTTASADTLSLLSKLDGLQHDMNNMSGQIQQQELELKGMRTQQIEIHTMQLQLESLESQQELMAQTQALMMDQLKYLTEKLQRIEENIVAIRLQQWVEQDKPKQKKSANKTGK